MCSRVIVLALCVCLSVIYPFHRRHHYYKGTYRFLIGFSRISTPGFAKKKSVQELCRARTLISLRLTSALLRDIGVSAVTCKTNSE